LPAGLPITTLGLCWPALDQWPRPSIAVAGSHAKGLPATLVAHASLAVTGQDPTAVIVGWSGPFRRNARVGQGPLWLPKADEPIGSLVKSGPAWAITNLELDPHRTTTHLEAFIETLTEFADGCGLVPGETSELSACCETFPARALVVDRNV